MSSSLHRPIPNRPQSSATTQKRGSSLIKRQYVRFAFYKTDPLWRRLSPEKQAEQKQELLKTIRSFGRRMLLRPYSLMGTRADAELLLWQIAESIEPFQALATAIMSTRMGGYLHLTHSYLSQTKRSIYEIRDNPDEDAERLVIQPSEAKYLFVYPFVKTRPWYRLTLPARQDMMDEHIQVGRKYPAVKLNTTYSFGLDDQEFVVAFETDEPSDFLDLVQDLRETEASLYTLRDTPLFTCVRVALDEALDALGGPPIAVAQEPDRPHSESEIEVCLLEDLPPGERKLVYLDGQQIAVFNVNGTLYAITNRCTHARGPLSEGTVETNDEGCSVICPWHYARFDLASGQVIDGVASMGVATYRVEVREGVIWVGTAVRNSASKRDQP
ncbi:MAG: Rieske 2Fe-2S domain-containing protein [Anaerolineae bacterium]|nr:Rieske 2Fe-2S domain-containing protein [Anaerolineae bacterium]